MDHGNGASNDGKNATPREGPKNYSSGQYTPRNKLNVPRTEQNTTYNRQSLLNKRRSSSSTVAPTNMTVGSLDLKKFLFSLRGRLSASWYVVAMVGLIVLSSMSYYILLPMCAFLPGPIKGLAMISYVLLVLWSCIALTVRRLHDLGHSGWWFLIYFIPFLNMLLLIYLCFWKGKSEENMFGTHDSPAPLAFAILCYPIFALTLFLNLLPAASIIPSINRIPGASYLVPSSGLKDAKNVQQYVDAMPGMVRGEMDKDDVKKSIALVMLQGQMVAAGFFITDKRILISGKHYASAMQNGLAQQQKLQVKSLGKEAHVTLLIASSPLKQWYVFEVDQPVGKPGFLQEENRNALTAIGAFK